MFVFLCSVRSKCAQVDGEAERGRDGATDGRLDGQSKERWAMCGGGLNALMSR